MTELPERHASWPELFFDLVAVAGVSVVAHQLEAGSNGRSIAVLAIAFIAFWIVWASVTTYGNLLADSASMAVLFASMAVLGVMAAAVPEITGEHARTFAVAYVVGRILIARPWRRTSVVVDLPIVQTTFGVVPWIVSIWIAGDARYVWWAVGIGLDLLRLLTSSGEKLVSDAQRRLDRLLAARSKQGERASTREADASGRPGRQIPELPTIITALKGDSAHLSERMGLFVLIILGEAIVHLIVAAEASEQWNRPLFLAAIGGFAFVCAVFVIAVVRGTAGLALLTAPNLPARALWLGHLVVSMSLVTVGAAVGHSLEAPRAPASGHTAWMLALGTAGYGVISAAAHIASREPRALAMAGAVAGPTLVAAAIVALAHAHVAAGWLAWILAAGVVTAGALGGRVGAAKKARSGGPKKLGYKDSNLN